jgi:glycosyltransferase involved in cell wall biosynthesis
VSARRIAVVMSGFPRRSETFALGELLALEERGALAAIFATKPGEAGMTQPGCERLLGKLQVLPEGDPARQAAFVAERLAGRRVGGVHGYFAHTPAEVAAHAAALLGVPYGFSTHARDARKVAPTVLAERARKAACVIACNTDVAEEFRRGDAVVHLLPHGVDLLRFHPQPHEHSEELRLLSVGRLVEKKGFHVLLDAVARLSFPFRLRIIGEGPERVRLTSMVKTHGLQDRVTLEGTLTHADLPAAYAESDAVVVPSVQDSSGDRDGLPNVVLEALACGRAVVASDISAVGSAIDDGETGLLVPPDDAAALAAALERLAHEPALREQLGRDGRARVERDFEVGRCTERLHQLLTSVYCS